MKAHNNTISTILSVLAFGTSLFAAAPIGAKPAATVTSRNAKILQSLQKTSLPQWVAQCIPAHPKVAGAACCSAKDLLDALQTYSAQSTAQFSSLAKQQWVEHDIVNTKKFQPFTQKLLIPAYSTVYMWGDLHGDVQALAHSLEKLHAEGVISDHFKIKQPNTYFLFLGDYTDRGQYGAEVMYTLLRLKIANPETVILIRGNHEDTDLNTRLGFFSELKRKFPAHTSALMSACGTFYNSLPVVLFVGSPDTSGNYHYVQCCHGGMEIGYHPRALFALPQTVGYERITELPRLQTLTKIKPHMKLAQQQLFAGNTVPQNYFYDVSKNKLEPYEIGFMWNDFSATGDTTLSWFNSTRRVGLSYGQNLTETLLRYYNAQSVHKVCGVIRAHQHNETMPGLLNNQLHQGLYKLPWHVPVFTTVATQQYMPGLCTFLKVTTACQFSDWKMTRMSCGSNASWQEITDTLEHY